MSYRVVALKSAARATRPVKSVSAWMTDAARRALLVRDGLRAVTEWEAEQGSLTDTELAAARERVSAALRDCAAVKPR